jgi:hypothetical protein
MTEPVKLEIPVDASKNVELTKYYTFNETGNIMMATTVGASAEVQESVRKVFAEVSVFFAAMTKAITSTVNPVTQERYSIYNYDALAKIIAGSGCFIQVTEMDVTHTTSSWGATFSKELIQGLLGLATGAGSLGFATAMISAIGNEGLKISGSDSKHSSKVGNIVFVCEYLLGMPSISAIVVYIDAKDQSKVFSAGPCLKTESHSMTFKMHKDTYMFVTPTFVREYAADLNSIGSDADYGDLVKSMRDRLASTDKPAETPASKPGPAPAPK